MRELAYTGDRMGAERAERLGFVNGVFDDHAAAVAGALAVAHKIAARAPVAVAASKEMINFTRDHSVAETFTYMNALQPACSTPKTSPARWRRRRPGSRRILRTCRRSSPSWAEARQRPCAAGRQGLGCAGRHPHENHDLLEAS